eukprot:TRINITY_DN3601_c0_g1_i3.p1 TRINITY_DN3601_c0_g1~~TRINITY_DN3601_c0_g1_i3.p1  ORF type:complete len:694 (+),score=255.39 TRINITY_DN3601_c0_g1_i3:44-2125(+)
MSTQESSRPLDITTEDIDFDEIDNLMSTFQSDSRIKESLQTVTNLKEYQNSLDLQLREVQRESVEDYMRVFDDLQNLQIEIDDCDGILSKMEDLLTKFQSNLGNIGQEIKSLQDQSSSLSLKLQNRKVVGEKVSKFIDDILIPPKLIKLLCEEEVNEKYITSVEALRGKIEFFLDQKAQKIAAVTDIQPVIDQLIPKVSFKIRAFLISQFQNLKKQTNIHYVQQSITNYKQLSKFLFDHSRNVATQLLNDYVELIKSKISNDTKSYVTSLLLLKIDIATRNDLIGAGEDNSWSFFSQRTLTANRNNIFSIGEGVNSRINILQDNQIFGPAIVPHEAVNASKKFPYEILFRSINASILQTTKFEYEFIYEMFPGNCSVISDIFASSCGLIFEQTQIYCSNCFDVIGMLIMIQLSRKFKIYLQENQLYEINSFENLYSKIEPLLWSRVNELFQQHIDSLANANSRSLGTEMNRIEDLHAHFVTRRFAEFICAISVINLEHKILTDSVEQLTKQFEQLLARLVNNQTDPKRKFVFQINNYYHIISTLKERNLATNLLQKFNKTVTEFCTVFIQSELQSNFKNLLLFVKSNGWVLESTGMDTSRVNKVEAENIVKEFGKSYKEKLKTMQRNISSFFTNFTIGNQIFDELLLELADNYSRFEQILKKCCSQLLSFNEFIPTSTFNGEIKQIFQNKNKF